MVYNVNVIKNFPDSNSQAHQESFVLNVLNEKFDGYYVELGGGWAIKNSNTYLLETQYGWQGLSVENNPQRAAEYNKIRSNKTLCVDGVTFDYKDYFIKNNFPQQIDYLQMDLHPETVTFEALKLLPLDDYRFSVITYEHNQSMKSKAEDLLRWHGYKRVVNNLTYLTLPYEDWWIDPTVVPLQDYEEFISSDINHKKLFGVWDGRP